MEQISFSSGERGAFSDTKNMIRFSGPGKDFCCRLNGLFWNYCLVNLLKIDVICEKCGSDTGLRQDV